MNHSPYSINLHFKTYSSSILIAFLLIAYICIAPNSDLFFYDNKRIAEISLILLTLITLSTSRYAQKNLTYLLSFLDRSSIFLLSLLLGLGITSALLAPSSRHAFIEIISFFSLFIIALQCSPVWRHFPKLLPWIGLALLVSIFIQEIKFISYYFAFIINNHSFNFHDFFFTFTHPRFFNQYQLWTLPLLTLVLILDHPYLKAKHTRYLLWAIAIIWWIMFFTTHGRGVVVAVTSSYLITFILFKQKTKTFLKTTLILNLLGFIFYQIFFHLIPHMLSNDLSLLTNSDTQAFSIRSTSSGRLTHLWPKALQLITENPWLGIGPMHYHAWNGGIVLAHPHNSILQIGAEWGIPALLCVLILLYRTFRNWIHRFNSHSLNKTNSTFTLSVIGLTFSLCSAFILSLFSGVIVMPMSHLIGILVISFSLSIFQPGNLTIEPQKTKQNWTMTFIFSILTISYFWLLSPDLIPRLVNSAFTPDNILGVNGPRFWMVGGDIGNKL